VGAAAGAMLGFIVGDLPGAIGGLLAGGRLGAVRDNHQRSVYEVYQELDQKVRSAMLAKLAQRVFAQFT
jgi:hypothetical protein